VLAHLILNANRVIAAEQLIDALWGEAPPDTARATLQAYISRLRSLLGSDVIEGRTPGYLLRAQADEIDALRFERLLHDARRSDGEPRATAATLADALDLWRGPALSDLATEPSLAPDIARLEELRLQATEEALDIDLDLGRQTEAVARLEVLTLEHPLRERLWGEMMLALYRAGRPADALGAFERARVILADELGTDPSRDLQELHAKILRQDPSLDLQGEPLRGYRLLDQIGEGAFGVVYRAIQPQVEREVAIKAVHPELANHPDFVRRFEREAQIVARLEHPHVVPLYDYWREPDAAYLVMRYLRGGSVEDLLAEGSLESYRTASILDQVAAALSAAHRQGIVHRDVKPGNILLDEEGNAYLTDFGVALDAGAPEQTTGTMLRGTPAYLSPEQIRLEPATSESDTYALGVVLYEMLAGEHPFPDSSLTVLLDQHLRQPLPHIDLVRPDLPAGVGDVIVRATAKVADDRFADPIDLAQAFRQALEGSAKSAEPPQEIRNPYKGLRAFLEADAGDFFGREVVTDRLLRRLQEQDATSRFLAVVGPSGSGKSSVVRAGLVPALRRGAIDGSERWYVIDVMPGTRPFRELETALLSVAVDPPPSLLDDLETDAKGLVNAADRVLPDPDAELLIVIDQLEEVFTLVADENERGRLLTSLWTAALDPASRIRIVTTLRADFFDAPLSIRGFGDLLAVRTEAITPMSPEELERAIVAPAERAGLRVEPRLLAAMVADVVDRPGALPLLQFALTELADRRSDGVLTLEGYRKINGVSGALGRRAEQLYQALDEPGKHACRQAFLRLVTLGEGGEDTRRRAPRSELSALADRSAIEDVLESYGRHRLLSFDRDPSTREPTVEIAHEALLGVWTRLHDWIDDARDDIRTQRRLSADAVEWESAQRDESFLLRGARLEQAASWARTAGSDDLSGFERVFLTESLRASELASERQRRTNRRLRSMLVGVAVFLALALVAGGIALLQRSQAEQAATEALSQSLALKVDATDHLDIALLLAKEGVQLDDSQRTESNLLSILLDTPAALPMIRAGTTGFTPQAIAVSPDGNRIAVVNGDSTVTKGNLRLFDASTGQAIGAPIDGVAPTGYRLPAFVPDGSEVAVLGWHSVMFVNVETLEVERSIDIGENVHDFFSPVLLSPDGRVLYLAINGVIDAFDTSTGRHIRGVEAPGVSCQGIALAQGTGQIVTLTAMHGGQIQIRHGRTLSLERSFPAPVGVDYCSSFVLAVSPDGRVAAYGQSNLGGDEAIRFVDLRSGKVRVGIGPPAGGDFVAISPDGHTAISLGDDYLHVTVWDIDSASPLETLSGPVGPIESAAFDPSGTIVYAASDDGTVFAWDLSGARSFGRAFSAGPGGYHSNGLAYPYVSASADGSLVVPYARHLPDGSADGGGVSIIDFARGGETQRIPIAGRAPGVSSVSYAELSPDGTELLVSPGPGSDGDITLWRLEDGSTSLIRTFKGLTATPVPATPERFHSVPWATFSPDGRWVAGVDRRRNGTSRMIEWSAATGALRAAPLDLAWSSSDTSIEHESVVYSRDGSLIATSALGNRTVIVDAETLKPIRALPDPDEVAFVDFSPTDPDLLAEASAKKGVVHLWNVRTGEEIQRVLASTSVFPLTSAAFDPSGRMLVTMTAEGVARLWSVPALEQIGADLPGIPSTVGAATFVGSGAGTTAVLVYDTGSAFAYPASLDAWKRKACLVAGRNLTRSEWSRYVGDRPYEVVCPGSAPAG